MGPSNDKAQTSLDCCYLSLDLVELVENLMVVRFEPVVRLYSQAVFGWC